MCATVPRPIVERHFCGEADGLSASTPLQLAPEDKLDLLRYLDEFHYWHSLDDERRCKRCSRLITGRQILVLELKGTRGKMRLQCPTVGCMSTPSEWVYADPVLAAKLRSDFRPVAPKSRPAAAIKPAPNAPARPSFRSVLVRLGLASV